MGIDGMCNSITAKLKSGVKYDGINFSLSLQMPVFDSRGVGSKALANVTAQNIAGGIFPGDASSQAAFISRVNSTGPSAEDTIRIKALVEQYRPKETQAYKTMLAEASKRGVPVTVGRGNTPDALNPLALYEPTISVGSTGKNNVISGFSSKVGKADALAQGELNHTKVPGGIDVTGDRKADFPTSALSGGTSALSGVLGKSFESVKASEADYAAVVSYYTDNRVSAPAVGTKVFDLQKLTGMISAAAAKSNQGVGAAEAIRNQYAVGSKYLAFSSTEAGLYPQPINIEQNRVVIDVTGKGGQNVVAASVGTSWAAPISLVDRAIANANANKGF